ncbi:FAD-binding oxidoreductase [Sphingobium boeckii]|uniref:FAD/FMN-containing dehydrogenase n=1 Tax=Sphingobium boeckii TaxID=1082345 RepID=A0A7W9AFP8_9SPHN|nr:FAD-binding oxidoreductase [Sphingobium boeckii]MBB5684601.1 FAD/FMN-containing dehydrogenase [Sphingobium boeckii]
MIATLDAVAALVGAANLLTDAPDMVPYQSDGRQADGAARAVARPGSTAEVSALMRLAAERGLCLVPQGARTGLTGGGLADNGATQIILSLDRLNRPPRIDAANRSADCDAGVRLSTLNAAAADDGLTFPIDLGADPSIGGMVATNTGGARFLRYGDVRRNLLGLEVVLADGKGTVAQFGHGLWKDNAGIDLKQIFAGSAGALGVVTRATVALQPLPASRVTALVGLPDDPALALDLLLQMEQCCGPLLAAFEGISGTAMRLALDHVPRVTMPFATLPPFAALIELAGMASLDDSALEDMMAHAIAPFADRVGEIAMDRRNGLWALRHAVPEGLRAAGSVIACDISVRRGDLFPLRAALTQLVASRWPALMICDFGHIGDGGLHFNMVWPDARGPIPLGLAGAVRTAIFETVVSQFGGSFSAEHGIGPRNAAHYDALVPPALRSLAGDVQALIAPYPLGRISFGGTHHPAGA